MQNQRQRINRLACHEHVELHEITFPITREVVVQRRITTRHGFQSIVKIQHDLVQRQLIREHHAIRRDVLKTFLQTALLFEQRKNPAKMFIGRQDDGADHWLFDLRDASRIWHLRRRIDLQHLAVSRRHYVTHAGSSRDQIEIKLTLQSLLHDFHVQQTEKATAKPKTERRRRLRLVKE